MKEEMQDNMTSKIDIIEIRERMECGCAGHIFSLCYFDTGCYQFRCIKCGINYCRTKVELTEHEKNLVELVLNRKV